jgi:hypothetical protein
MRRGMTNVRCNRTVAVTTEEGRKSAPLEAMSNRITEGMSNGWALIYARGPEGEALEFVQFTPADQRAKRLSLFRHWVLLNRYSTRLWKRDKRK